MTRQELKQTIRTLSSGTIAHAVNSTRYSVIDKAVNNAVIYASEQASDAEIAACTELEDVLSFIREHQNYRPSWL